MLPTDGARSGALGSDVAAWSLNVSTSVLIVFVNKVLMDAKHGYGFVFASCLCALHFFVSGGAVRAYEALGFGAHVKLPLKGTLRPAGVATCSPAYPVIAVVTAKCRLV
jgi:solute carrier family 35 protein E3